MSAVDTRFREPLHPHQQDVAPACNSCATSCGSHPPWCVAETLPKAERRAHAELHRRGFDAYLPLITVRRPNRHYHTGPAFPRYVFVRMDLTKPWNPVRYAPGVFNLVSFDGKPATCSDAAVEAVRKAVDAADAFSAAGDAWKPGAPCSLAAGPLAGMSGIVLSVGHDMALVSLMMLGHLREVAVQLSCLSQRDNGG